MAADLFSSLLAVAKGLAAAATTVPVVGGAGNLRASHVPVGLVNTPMFVVGPMTYDLDSAGPNQVDEVTFVCRLYAAPAGSERDGYEALYAYMATSGPQSVAAALLLDPTLGGVCLGLRPQRWQGPALFDVGTSQYIGAVLEVEVH